jgi:hypothetical protein
MTMIKRFGRWRVDDFGLTTHAGGEYKIVATKDRLWDTQFGAAGLLWASLLGVALNSWVNEDNADDLLEAFYFAQEHFKDLRPSNIGEVSKEETEMLVRRYASENRGMN